MDVTYTKKSRAYGNPAKNKTKSKSGCCHFLLAFLISQHRDSSPSLSRYFFNNKIMFFYGNYADLFTSSLYFPPANQAAIGLSRVEERLGCAETISVSGSGQVYQPPSSERRVLQVGSGSHQVVIKGTSGPGNIAYRLDSFIIIS